MNANEQNNVPNEAANGYANAPPETGDQFRERLGIQPRTFQKNWKKIFGYAFDSRREVTAIERETMEAKYLVKNEVKVVRAEKKKTVPTVEKESSGVETSAPSTTLPSGKNWSQIIALSIAFLLPTLASAFNTYSVSHQISKNEWVAMFLMLLVMLTPILFIIARMDWTGIIVAFIIVVFEGFCNASATYLALMGGMEYILDTKRGQCSEFLQSVVNLTSSDHRPTAILLGTFLAFIIAATQLTAFWGIRKRV